MPSEEIDPTDCIEMKPEECKDALDTLAESKTRLINNIDDPVRIGNRMAELRAMGFWDIPSIPGASSSIRCYAEATLFREDEVKNRNTDGEEPCIFTTTNKAILARADELNARYHVLPLSTEESLKRMKTNKGQACISEKTIEQVADVMYRDLCKELGIDDLPPELKKTVLLTAKEHVKKRLFAVKLEENVS